ncbi:hypothetical protein [Sphingomonas melonis]|nr:hypothetical protein [Sphingomonas melonis]
MCYTIEMLGIPFVIVAVAILAFLLREQMKDGTFLNKGWGAPIAGAVGLCLLVVAAGVLMNWGMRLAL